MLLLHLLLAAFLGYSFALPAEQVPLVLETGHERVAKHTESPPKSRELKGKFLHITGWEKSYQGTYEPAHVLTNAQISI